MSCISWLRLERYHLGELESDERKMIADHLATCDACAALRESITTNDSKTDLPALQLPTPPITIAVAAPRPPWYARTRTMAVVGGLALAAAILIGIGRRRHPDPQLGTDPDPTRVKGNGSTIAFELVRENNGLVPEAGGPYRDGERFKALVTCPPGLKARFDVAVYENGVASFPLDANANANSNNNAVGEVSCGNSVPLPGAFRVTGNARMTVCLVWQLDGEGPHPQGGPAVDREVIRRTPPDLLLHAQCKILEPAPVSP